MHFWGSLLKQVKRRGVTWGHEAPEHAEKRSGRLSSGAARLAVSRRSLSSGGVWWVAEVRRREAGWWRGRGEANTGGGRGEAQGYLEYSDKVALGSNTQCSVGKQSGNRRGADRGVAVVCVQGNRASAQDAPLKLTGRISMPNTKIMTKRAMTLFSSDKKVNTLTCPTCITFTWRCLIKCFNNTRRLAFAVSENTMATQDWLKNVANAFSGFVFIH